MDDLSSREGNPSRDPDEAEDTKYWRLQEGHVAMASLQGVMASKLQGCDGEGSTSSDGSWFSFGLLAIWTTMLAGYTWYMVRNMNKFTYIPPQPMPSTAGVPEGPEVKPRRTGHVDAASSAQAFGTCSGSWEPRGHHAIQSDQDLTAKLHLLSSWLYSGTRGQGCRIL